MPPNYVMATVLRPAGLPDCTNGGLSATSDRVCVLAPYASVPDGVNPSICLRLVRPGTAHYVLEPVVAKPSGRVGWMAGGNFAVGSGAAWRDLTGARAPLPIHDRSETRAAYDSMD